jgi:porin
MKWKIGWVLAPLLAAAAMLHAASQETQATAQSSPESQPPAQSPAQQISQLPTSPQATVPASTAGSVNGAPGFWTQNYLTGDWGGVRDDLKKDGVSFTPIWTDEVFGNPSGGARQGVIDDGLFDLLLDVDLDPLSGGALKDTTFHAEAFYIYGPSLSTNYVGDFSDTSNISAYNTLRLGELWVQKAFWDKKVTVKVGNQAIDLEYFVSSSGALFLNGTFGAPTFIANNIPNAPTYPLASPGVRIQVLPDPRVYLLAGVYGEDNGSFPNTTNKNGTHFALNGSSGMLVMSEAGFLLNQQPNDKGLQGSYRLGSFVNTGNSATFESQGEFDTGMGNLQGAGANYGVYGVVDQQVYADGPRVVSIFTRAGGAPASTNFVDYYVDAGFNLIGFIPGRDKDVGGVAFARSHVSPDYSDSEVAEGERPFSAESVVEATYKVQLAPWWNVQPDFQYVITPSGVVGSHNAVVLGVRTTVAF